MVLKGHSILMRRHTVAILGFLCSIVMHAQRINISIAMVSMTNSTNAYSISSTSNETECPASLYDISSSEVHAGEFSWNPELQGYILSAGFLGYVLSQIPGGILSGRFGTKPVLISGIITASVCNLLSPFAARQHAYLLAFVTLVRGMAQGVQQPALSVLMSKWFPRSERGFLSAFIYCGYPMGGFVGSLISGALCELHFLGGWPLVFYAFGLFGLFISSLFICIFAEKPSDDPKISEMELKHILKNQERNVSTRRTATPWGAMLCSVPTYALIVALFGQYWMAFYFLSVHPIYLGTILNIPIKENGILSSGPYLLQAVVGFCACCLSFWLSRNSSAKVNTIRKGLNTISCAVFTVGMLGVYLSGCDSTWNEVCLFIATGSVGFAFGGSLITAVDMSPTYCGTLMGFSSTVASLAGFVITVMVGTLTNEEQTMVQWQKIFLITSAVGAGSGLIYLSLGSADIQPWATALSKDVNMNDPEKAEKRNNHS